MPKVKVPRKSTHVDMTAMCDVAFLLLTFFMLTTKFKPQDPVKVVTPSAISTQLLPESHVALVLISKDGRVFYGLDDQNMRQELIQAIDHQYNLGLTPSDIKNFSNSSVIGMPINKLKSFLDLPPDQAKRIQQPGIPVDSTNDELLQWITYTVTVNNGDPRLQFVIKADNDTKYPVIQQVLETMKKKDEQKLHLITNLKSIPPGTPAYQEEQSSIGSKPAK